MSETKCFESVKVTAKGLKLLTKVHAGETLRFTRAVIGDGYMADGQNSVNLTNIINEIPSHQTGEEASTATVDLTRYDMIDEGVLTLRVKIRNGDTEFYLRELGVMAEDPDDGEILYAYVNFGDNASVMPAFDGNTYISRSIDLAFTISNTVNIDANITFPAEVSYEEFELHRNASVLDHPDGSVTKEKIAKYSIDAERIEQYAVTKTKIYPGAILTDHIADNAVTENKLSSKINSILDDMLSKIDYTCHVVDNLKKETDIIRIKYSTVDDGQGITATIKVWFNGVEKFCDTKNAEYPSQWSPTYLDVGYDYNEDSVNVDLITTHFNIHNVLNGTIFTREVATENNTEGVSGCETIIIKSDEHGYATIVLYEN